MALTITVEERLQSEAEFGLFFVHAKLTKTKAENLRKEGFHVIDLQDARNFPRLHYISWKDVAVDCEDVFSLDETSDEYTFPQKLWITSMKNQPKEK